MSHPVPCWSQTPCPMQALCPARQQVAGRRCSLAGDVEGGPSCFLPVHCFPQLLAVLPQLTGPGRKAGWRETVNVQPGLSKRHFLLPPSAASATVASGRLSNRQGHFPELSLSPAPPAHLAGLPAWGTTGCSARPESTILGGSRPPAPTRPGGGDLAGHLLWGLDIEQGWGPTSRPGRVGVWIQPTVPSGSRNRSFHMGLCAKTGLGPWSLQPSLATSLTISVGLGV